MGWKKLIMGEKMPDRDDPRYQKQYEREVDSGRRFAERLKLDVPFVKAQLFANRHPIAFLVIAFGFVIVCFCFNVCRFSAVCNSRKCGHMVTATEQQEKRLQELKDSVIMHNIKSE